MFQDLLENILNEEEPILPDWAMDAIERFFQAVESGEYEGDPELEDVMDFVVSINPDKEFTKELRNQIENEILSHWT